MEQFNLETLISDIDNRNYSTQTEFDKNITGDILCRFSNDLRRPKPFQETTTSFTIFNEKFYNDMVNELEQYLNNNFAEKANGVTEEEYIKIKTEYINTVLSRLKKGWLSNNEIDGYTYLLNKENSHSGRRYLILRISDGLITVDNNELTEPVEPVTKRKKKKKEPEGGLYKIYEGKEIKSILEGGLTLNYKLDDTIWNYLLPYNIKGNHWILFHYDMINQKIIVYDSLKDVIDYEVILKNLAFTHVFAKDFKVELPKVKIPKQRDENNCGVFCIYYAKVISGYLPERNKLEEQWKDTRYARLRILYDIYVRKELEDPLI